MAQHGFAAQQHSTESGSAQTIDPSLSLELRIRWLEVLLLGVKHEQSSNSSLTESLVRGAQALHNKLDDVAHSNDGVKNFIDRCKKLAI